MHRCWWLRSSSYSLLYRRTVGRGDEADRPSAHDATRERDLEGADGYQGWDEVSGFFFLASLVILFGEKVVTWMREGNGG